MVGAIGAVDFGSAAISALQDAGVDLSTMERSAGFTGTAVICVEYGRENTITVVPGAYGPINRILLQSGPVLKVELKIPYSNTQTMERGLRAES
jgi:sugar/nucleoside kinase (ribokinase family)